MEWLFSGFLGLLSQVVMYVICYFIGKITTPITMSSELFEIYFPQISRYLWIFQGMALSILVLITLIQLMRGMLGQTANGEVDHPGVLMMKSAIAVILIIGIVPMMQFFMEMIRLPYNYKDDAGNYFQIEAEENLFEGGFRDLMSSVFKESREEDMRETVFGHLMGIDSVKNLGEISGFAISLILMLILGWQMIRYLIEVLERFVLFILLMITAMFPIATFPSRATSGIFRKWLEMLFSSTLMCFFNMFFLRIISGSFSLVYGSANDQILSNGTVTNPVLGTFVILAMVRIARSWDQYMGQLFTSAQTGAGLGWEIMSAGHQLFGLFRGQRFFAGGWPFGGEGETLLSDRNGIENAGHKNRFLETEKISGSHSGEGQESALFKKPSTEDQKDTLKSILLEQGSLNRQKFKDFEVDQLTLQENGDMTGILKGEQGAFAELEWSECGGVGSFKLQEGEGFLTLNSTDDEQFHSFLNAFAEGSESNPFNEKIYGSVEGEYYQFGNLSLERASVEALVPDLYSAQKIGTGQYQLFDNQDQELGTLSMLTGQHPSVDHLISGRHCNYSYTPYDQSH